MNVPDDVIAKRMERWENIFNVLQNVDEHAKSFSLVFSDTDASISSIDSEDVAAGLFNVNDVPTLEGEESNQSHTSVISGEEKTLSAPKHDSALNAKAPIAGGGGISFAPDVSDKVTSTVKKPSTDSNNTREEGASSVFQQDSASESCEEEDTNKASASNNLTSTIEKPTSKFLYTRENNASSKSNQDSASGSIGKEVESSIKSNRKSASGNNDKVTSSVAKTTTELLHIREDDAFSGSNEELTSESSVEEKACVKSNKDTASATSDITSTVQKPSTDFLYSKKDYGSAELNQDSASDFSGEESFDSHEFSYLFSSIISNKVISTVQKATTDGLFTRKHDDGSSQPNHDSASESSGEQNYASSESYKGKPTSTVKEPTTDSLYTRKDGAHSNFSQHSASDSTNKIVYVPKKSTPLREEQVSTAVINDEITLSAKEPTTDLFHIRDNGTSIKSNLDLATKTSDKYETFPESKKDSTFVINHKATSAVNIHHIRKDGTSLECNQDSDSESSGPEEEASFEPNEDCSLAINNKVKSPVKKPITQCLSTREDGASLEPPTQYSASETSGNIGKETAYFGSAAETDAKVTSTVKKPAIALKVAEAAGDLNEDSDSQFSGDDDIKCMYYRDHTVKNKQFDCSLRDAYAAYRCYLHKDFVESIRKLCERKLKMIARLKEIFVSTRDLQRSIDLVEYYCSNLFYICFYDLWLRDSKYSDLHVRHSCLLKDLTRALVEQGQVGHQLKNYYLYVNFVYYLSQQFLLKTLVTVKKD